MWRTDFTFCIECSPEYFGMYCKERCSGHCINNKPCHHVNGECSNGCKDGYVGSRCTEGKKYPFIVTLVITKMLFVHWTDWGQR